MIVLGITGPTGAGKTTLLREVEKLGGAVIDCDAVYHEMLETDTALQGKLEKAFGPLRDASGHIDRKKLGNIVFHDPEKMRVLNEIALRAVGHRSRALIEAYVKEHQERSSKPEHALIAVDAPLLLENGELLRACDMAVAVLAPPEVRVQRIIAREGISEEYAWARVKAQKPDEYYIEGCLHSRYTKVGGHVLVNDCVSREAFRRKARDFLTQILEEGIVLQGWHYDFGSLPGWMDGRPSLVEHTGSDSACLFYNVHETSMCNELGSLALFKNKKAPRLLFQTDSYRHPDWNRTYSRDGTFLFLKAWYVLPSKDERVRVFLILDMVRERSSSYPVDPEFGWAYAVQEEAPDRFMLRVPESLLKVNQGIRELRPQVIEISKLEWEPFSQLGSFPGWHKKSFSNRIVK